MRKLIAATLAVSILAIPAALPASALPIDAAPRWESAADPGVGPVQEVAFRRSGGFRGGGFRRGGLSGFRSGMGGRRGFGGRRFGGFGGRRFSGGRRFGFGGYGIGPGIAGLAAGAIIGGAIAAGTRGNSAVAYCRSRFKSYNPATGTYLGYDGRHHHCP